MIRAVLAGPALGNQLIMRMARTFVIAPLLLSFGACGKDDVDFHSPSSDAATRPAPHYEVVSTVMGSADLELGGQCFSDALSPNAAGQVDCAVLSAFAEAGCDCQARGLTPVTNAHAPHLAAALSALETESGGSCVCEAPQLDGDALVACRSSLPPSESSTPNGWCYFDAHSNQCPSGWKGEIWFPTGLGIKTGNRVAIVCALPA
jgi:hypothetical protein